MIGDIEGLKRKFGAFAEMSQGEQGASVAAASEETLQVWEPFVHVWVEGASLPQGAYKTSILLPTK